MRFVTLTALALFSAPTWAQISVLDTGDVLLGGTYTAAAGTDRLYIHGSALLVEPVDPQEDLSTLDYGATNITPDADATRYNASPDQSLISGIGHLIDANIPGGANAVDVTLTPGNDTPTEGSSANGVLTVDGADQSTPVVDFDTQAFVDGSAELTATAEDGGIAIYVTSTNAGSDEGVPTGYTLVAQDTGTSIGYKLITADGTETVNHDVTGGLGSAALVTYRQAEATDFILQRRRLQ